MDSANVIARSGHWEKLAKEVWEPCRYLWEECWSEEQKRRLLLKRPAEPDDAYGRRVRAAYLDNHYAPAVRGYAALLSDFSLEDAPDAFEWDADSDDALTASDLDLNGSTLKVFVNNVIQTALVLGTAIVIVDFQNEAGRPYLRLWPIDSVYGFRSHQEDGRTITDGFCCKYEEVEEVEGHLISVDYYLQYLGDPARTQLWKQGQSGLERVGEETVIRGANGQPLDQIPFVWFSLSVGVPGDPALPLLFSLAKLNINNFNSLSEFQTILTVVNGPTPVRFWAPGSPPPEERPDMEIGVNSVLDMPGGSDVRFLEPSGNALGISLQVIQGQIEAMQRLGQRYLSGGDAARTATEVMLDAAQSKTLLEDLAGRVQSLCQEIFKLWLVFSDASYSYPDFAGSVVVNTKGLLMPMSAVEASTLESFFLNGLIDAPTAIKAMVRGQYLKEDDLSDALEKFLSKAEDMAADAPKKATQEDEEGSEDTEEIADT